MNPIPKGLDVQKNFMFHPSAQLDSMRILAGAYAVPGLNFGSPPMVLDVGACCGAFARYAKNTWPGCRVECVEPHPQNVENIRVNNDADVIHVAAVTDKPGKVTLYSSKKSVCEHSLGKRANHPSTPIEVDTVHPKDLPNCDVLKVDIEGAEGIFFKHYPYTPSLICVETHSQPLMREIIGRLWLAYALARGQIHNPDLAEMMFVRKELIKSSMWARD